MTDTEMPESKYDPPVVQIVKVLLPKDVAAKIRVSFAMTLLTIRHAVRQMQPARGEHISPRSDLSICASGEYQNPPLQD